jgi:hypothetical protein
MTSEKAACPREEGVMKRVNLDAQPEVVRQFVLTLSALGDAAILESAGRPWRVSFLRRSPGCELIDRKYDDGLSPDEEAELALLQDAMYRTIDKLAPLPLDAARSLHQELLQKLAQAPDASKT